MKQTFKYDWGGLIVDFVKKKDLDCDDFADCWSEEYDWTNFDLYLIENYYEDLVEWGVVRFKVTPKVAGTDLRKYEGHYHEKTN